RVLEALTVSLEELVRSALALDPDEQRLLVVHAAGELFGAFREEAARGALEEEKGRPRLELRVAGDELAIPLLERAQMLFLFLRQLLKHRAAAGVFRQPRCARVELEAA